MGAKFFLPAALFERLKKKKKKTPAEEIGKWYHLLNKGIHGAENLLGFVLVHP